jgi:TonB family protein
MQAVPSNLSRWLSTRLPSHVIGLLVFQIVVLPQSLLRAQDIQAVSYRKAVQKVAPAYPEIAKSMKLSGKVKIVAKVAPSGKVVSTEVVGGHPILARAAADAVLQWRYQPGPQQTSELAVITFEP